MWPKSERGKGRRKVGSLSHGKAAHVWGGGQAQTATVGQEKVA